MPAIVMATMETAGIRQMIDDLCTGLDEKDRMLSEGMAVKAMVGAMIERGKRPLYQVANYYSTAPVDKIFGPDVQHTGLSDTSLAGRLDTIFKLDLRQVLTKSYLLLKESFEFETGCMFLDGSNYTMFGLKYLETQIAHDLLISGNMEELKASPMPSYGGNPKDGRKDLVQLNISQVVDGNGIPICSKTFDGNASDITMNKDMVEYLCRTFDMKKTILMADCKLCVNEMVSSLSDSKVAFVTKVPFNFDDKLKEIVLYSALMGTMDDSQTRPGRQYFETVETIEGKRFRVIAYLLPHSKRDSERYIRGHGFESAQKKLKTLKGKRFFCEKDAMDAFMNTMSKLDAECYSADVDIIEDAAAEKRHGDGKKFRAIGKNLTIDESKLENSIISHAAQVLITNLPFSAAPSEDRRKAASADDVIDLYLEEYKVEASFKMMKSGMNIGDVYIHTPSRITVVAFIVSLATMICKVLDTMHPKLKEKGSRSRTIKSLADEHINTLLKYDRTHDRLSVMGPPGATGMIFDYIEAMHIDPQKLLGY